MAKPLSPLAAEVLWMLAKFRQPVALDRVWPDCERRWGAVGELRHARMAELIWVHSEKCYYHLATDLGRAYLADL